MGRLWAAALAAAFAAVALAQGDDCSCAASCGAGPGAASACHCPTGWSGLSVNGTGRCYKALCGPATWEVAHAECVAHNGTLAVIDTAETRRFVRGLVGGANAAWFGLRRANLSAEERWRWAATDNRLVAGHAGWAPGEPAGGSCAAFGRDECGEGWHAAPCNETLAFVCQSDWPSEWGAGTGAALCSSDTHLSDGAECDAPTTLAAPAVSAPLCSSSPPSDGPLFAVVSASPSDACFVTSSGSCFTDGPGDHGNGERCLVAALTTVYLSTPEGFSVEQQFDYLRVNGRRYSGSVGPHGVQVPGGSIIEWRTDASVTGDGFVVCGSTDMPVPPPVSPGAVFEVTASSPPGACYTTSSGTCLTDGGGAYGHNERCTVRVLRSAMLSASYFESEVGYDWMSIGGERYSGWDSPDGTWVAEGAAIQWQTDGSVSARGFTVCGQPARTSPAPTPAVSNTAAFEIVESSPGRACSVVSNGACFTDGFGRYGNSERCTVRVLRTVTLVAPRGFHTESHYDLLTIGSRTYSGNDGPSGVTVQRGTVITWSSDESVSYGGFYVCEAPPTAAPTPSPPGAIFTVTSSIPNGVCTAIASGACVTDLGSMAGRGGGTEDCVITVLRGATLSTPTLTAFPGRDGLVVGTQTFTGRVGPQGVYVAPGDRIVWQRSSSYGDRGRYAGFTLCGNETTSPAPTVGASRSMFAVTGASQQTNTESCTLTSEGRCFSCVSTRHGPRSQTSIAVLASVTLYLPAPFYVGYFDRLTVGGDTFQGARGPSGLHVSRGTQIMWFANGGGSSLTVCGAPGETGAPTHATMCAPGWTLQFGRCFKAVCTMRNWTSAQADCAAHGADLATADSFVVGDFLRDLVVGTGPVWIGLREDRDTRGSWSWVASSLSPNMTRWAPGEPSAMRDVRGNCAFFGWEQCDALWHDASCEAMRAAYVCEAPARTVSAWGSGDGAATCSGGACVAPEQPTGCDMSFCGIGCDASPKSADAMASRGALAGVVVAVALALLLVAVAVARKKAHSRRAAVERAREAIARGNLGVVNHAYEPGLAPPMYEEVVTEALGDQQDDGEYMDVSSVVPPETAATAGGRHHGAAKSDDRTMPSPSVSLNGDDDFDDEPPSYV